MIKGYKVSVKRLTNTGTSSSGAPSYKEETIYDSLDCDLQPTEGSVIDPEHGQTAIYYKTMFCVISDIQANDIVTDLATGERMKVINPNRFHILKHMEVQLQGGVVK